MGFSTSGSLLIIFLGLFLALGTVYTVSSNTSERLVEAYSDQHKQQQDIQDTEINVTRAIYHETDGHLTIRINNTGSQTLSVEATDTFVDGEYRAGDEFAVVTVDGNDTDIWEMGQQLRLENESTQPARVKVITEVGVADTATVTAMGLRNVSAATLDRSNNGTQSSIAFEIASSYDKPVRLVGVSIERVEGENPTFYNFSQDPGISEVNVSQASDPSTPLATADGTFTLGETVTHSGVELGPSGAVRYTVGEFRDSNELAVDMPDTTVTITLVYEDPRGVERTYTFTEDDF